MLIGPISKNPPPPLTLEGTVIDRVRTFKLLGVHVADDLEWQQHVDAIASKTASRLYYLKLLKRSGASVEDLLCFYTTVVRPLASGVCLSQAFWLHCWSARRTGVTA